MPEFRSRLQLDIIGPAPLRPVVSHNRYSMKNIFLLPAIVLLVLADGSTTQSAVDSSAKENPETVLVTYSVNSDKAAEFKAMLSRAWETYRKDNLVLPEPHIVVQDTDEDSKPRFVEIFTWVSRSIPEHAPTNVWTIWKAEHALCENRRGHDGIEVREVQLLVPSPK
jgi:hypothetical protein